MARKVLLAIFASACIGIVCTVCTAAPPALAASPRSFCAVVGAPARGPDAASPILGQGCFATRAAETAFVRRTIAAAAPNAAPAPFSAVESMHLGTAWSGENLTGSRYDFYGSNPGYCGGSSGYYYQFSNLHGPFDSATEDLASGANCEHAFWWSGSNFDGRDWDCYAYFNKQAYQSCGGRMPPGDDGAGHSVRFRH